MVKVISICYHRFIKNVNLKLMHMNMPSRVPMDAEPVHSLFFLSMEPTITSQLEMELNLSIDVVTFGQRVVGKFVVWPIDGATKKNVSRSTEKQK